MNVIASTRRNRRYEIFEADYLYFVLCLADRIGNDEAQERGGLPTVDVNTADEFISWLRQYTIDQGELAADFGSLSTEERRSSLPEFLPMVLIDFDNRTFFCAHPESYYLNYEAYLPKGWAFAGVESVVDLLPEQQRYWRTWGV